MTVRNVPLAERRAEARDLTDAIKGHQKTCHRCVTRKACPELLEMRADLREAQRDIRTWFAPGPDQGVLPL